MSKHNYTLNNLSRRRDPLNDRDPVSYNASYSYSKASGAPKMSYLNSSLGLLTNPSISKEEVTGCGISMIGPTSKGKPFQMISWGTMTLCYLALHMSSSADFRGGRVSSLTELASKCGDDVGYPNMYRM